MAGIQQPPVQTQYLGLLSLPVAGAEREELTQTEMVLLGVLAAEAQTQTQLLLLELRVRACLVKETLVVRQTLPEMGVGEGAEEEGPGLLVFFPMAAQE